MTSAIVNARIFDGQQVLEHHVVLISGDQISGVVPASQLPSELEHQVDLEGALLVPGFTDLQVNGGGGVLFNDAPTVEAIKAIGLAHRGFGTTGFLPTLISDSFEVMASAIAAVNEAIQQGVPGVLGIHLEGPFLNPAKKGTHDADKFSVLDERGLALLCSLRSGRTLVTLAPELTSADYIRKMVKAGLIVCAGHSAASYEDTRVAIDAGLHGFTHLFNAMTPLGSRTPGVVGAALEDDRCWCGVIADGYHVHPASLTVAMRAKSAGQILLVTDAMPSVGTDQTSFELNGKTIRVEQGCCLGPEGVLAGSDLNMVAAVRNIIRFTGVDQWEALRMASLYPAQALGLEHRLGRVRQGYAANLISLNDHFEVTRSWIAGRMMTQGDISTERNS